MPIGSSDGNFYETDFEFARDRPRVKITPPWVEEPPSVDSTMPPGGSTEPADALFSSGGMETPGNIDLTKRPVVKNSDGSISTVRSMSANFDGKEVLIPTVAHDGSRILSNEEAIQQYKDTGKHLGMFKTPEDATSYAEKLHQDQEKMYTEIRPVPDYMNPPEREGSFRPKMTEIIGGLWDSIKGAASFTQTPTWAQDPNTGEFHTNPQAIERAANLAELMTFGPGLMVGKAADGTLGSFIGAKAKTWDRNNFALAAILEKRGADKEEILQRTGMFRGTDKKWRTELSDADAVLDQEALKFHPVKTEAQREAEDKFFRENPFAQIPFDAFEGTSVANLGDFYKHPKLFEAYPHLKEARVIEDLNYKGIAEAEGYGIIRYNPENVAKTGWSLKEIIAHETQHLIQEWEGFSRGGGPIMIEENVYRLKHQLDTAQIDKLKSAVSNLLKKFERQGLDENDWATLERANKILDTHAKYIEAADRRAMENYVRLAGEVEARNVQTRILMDQETMRYSHPFETMDVDPSKQIDVKVGAGTTAYGLLGHGGKHIPVPPAMADIKSLRRAANDNATPAQQEEARKLRKAIRRQESDDAFAELQKIQREVEKRIAERPTPERSKELRESMASMRDILEKRDWTEIELRKYNNLGREFYGSNWTDMPFNMD